MGGLLVGLRALLMLLAGLYAVIWPVQALFILVWAGAIMLIVDGVLGLFAVTFGGHRTGNFWFDIIHNVLGIIVGILILASPIFSAVIGIWFLLYLLAFQAIIVGVMEIVIGLRERAAGSSIWPILLTGLLYIIFGIAILSAPMVAAWVLVLTGGILMILFSFALFALAWRILRGKDGGEASAAAA